MAVETSCSVGLQQRGMDGAVYLQHLVGCVARRSGTPHGGSPGVHNQRKGTNALRQCFLQQLKRDNGVLPSTDGHDVVLPRQRRQSFPCRQRFAQGDDLHKVLLGSLDAVDIEEFAQSVIVEFLPETHLSLGKGTTAHLDPWGAIALPVAHQFGHADIEHQRLHHRTRLVEREERTTREEGRRMEFDMVANPEGKDDVQPVGLHIILITLIHKHRVCLSEIVVFVL